MIQVKQKLLAMNVAEDDEEDDYEEYDEYYDYDEEEEDFDDEDGENVVPNASNSDASPVTANSTT